MLYADRAGNIGQLMATMLPVRLRSVPPDVILDPGDPLSQWNGVVPSGQLPAAYNPRGGVLASANNRPTETPFPVGYVFSPDDRVMRMRELLNTRTAVDLDDLKAVQRDVFVQSAATLRDAYIEALRRVDLDRPSDRKAARLLRLLADWDGYYRTDSRGAVAFELFHYSLQDVYYRRRYGEDAAQVLLGIAPTARLLLADLPRMPAAEAKAVLETALRRAARRLDSFADWGEMHRIGLAHPLAFVPVVGGRYRFGDYPAAGSSESVMKTAHASTDERHFTRFGQQARFIADMSDADAAFVVLLGGQDGWLGSSTAMDQVELWRRGEYVQLPLRPATVRAQFRRAMVVRP
jgi:penicillin amidase